MLSDAIYTANPAWEVPETEMSAVRLNNPALVFEKVMREVDQIYNCLETEYGSTIDDLELFLAEQDPRAMRLLNELWEQIDCDIYDQFKSARLTTRRYYEWKNSLEEWVKLFESVVRHFVYQRFQKIFEIPQRTALLAA